MSNSKAQEAHEAYIANHGEDRCPMSSSSFKQIMEFDLSHIKLPRYKKHDFHYLRNMITYKLFRNDVDFMNPTIVVGRAAMEAAWVQVLVERFVLWDENQLTKKFGEGNELRTKQEFLARAIFQRYGTWRDHVEDYWARRALLSPGLDTEAPRYDNTDQPPQGKEGEGHGALAFQGRPDQRDDDDIEVDNEAETIAEGEKEGFMTTQLAFRPKEKVDAMELD